MLLAKVSECIRFVEKQITHFSVADLNETKIKQKKANTEIEIEETPKEAKKITINVCALIHTHVYTENAQAHTKKTTIYEKIRRSRQKVYFCCSLFVFNTKSECMVQVVSRLGVINTCPTMTI